MAKIIAEAAPESLTLEQICLEVEYVWKLEFLTGMERSAWRRGSIARRLRDLVIQKKIVALHTKKGGDPTSEVARWKAI